MTVHVLKGKDEFDEKVRNGSKDTLQVVDFFATWCGPCKAIAPTIAEWSNSDDYSNIEFYKIDVDESPDVAQELSIRAMPTFLLFKNGEEVGKVVGANPPQILGLMKSNMQ